MNWEDWFEEALPTKWSRRVALATVAMAAGAYGLPSLLPTSYLPRSAEEIFLLRIILFLFVALAGTLLVLFLVVRKLHSHDSGEHADKADEQLSDLHERVIRLLFDGPRTVEEVQRALRVSTEQAYYYLHDLVECDMAQTPMPYGSGREEWCISQRGRQYVMARNES